MEIGTKVSKTSWKSTDFDMFRWENPKKQNKTRTYAKHKQNFKMESYITKVSFSARQTISKLRPSDHSLEIGRGRYQRPYSKPEERNCPFCPDRTENEYHF